jgi:hypothetical protein
VGGEDVSQGNVYFMKGPVCDDGWTLEDGHVACRELGFDSARTVTTASAFGPAYSPFSASHVQCTGQEVKLEQCQRRVADQTNCT